MCWKWRPGSPATTSSQTVLVLLRHTLHPQHTQVLISPHTAFLTKEALDNIASTTISSIEEFLEEKPLTNQLQAKQ